MRKKENQTAHSVKRRLRNDAAASIGGLSCALFPLAWIFALSVFIHRDDARSSLRALDRRIAGSSCPSDSEDT